MNRRVSIIVPTLQEAGTVGALLDDLQALRAAGHEVIVVDGGSSDDTLALAAPACDRLLHCPPGRAVQMNAGAAVAGGDILWFVHADTRLPASAMRAIEAASEAGAGWGRFDIRLSGSRTGFRLIETLINLRSRLTGIATGDQGLFVSRELFDTVGGYPAIALMEDVALSKSLLRHGRPACLHDRLTTSSRRWEHRGMWRTVVLMWRLRLAYALGADPDTLAERYR